MMIVTSFLEVVYIAKAQPYKKKWKNSVEIFNELVVLMVAIMSTAFAHEDVVSNEALDNLGWAVINIIIAQSLVNFMINLVIIIIKAYQWVKNKLTKEDNTVIQESEREVMF
jgi:dsRNA-specific ribonuclease